MFLKHNSNNRKGELRRFSDNYKFEKKIFSLEMSDGEFAFVADPLKTIKLNLLFKQQSYNKK